MYDRSEKDQPGLEVNANQDGLYTLYPVTNDKVEHLGDHNDVSKTQSDRRSWQNPFGLRPLRFALLIAFTTAIVVGAVVGGVIGGTMARSSSKDSSSSSQPTQSLTDPAGATPATSSSASPTQSATDATQTAQGKDYSPLAPSAVKLLQHPCPTQSYVYQINDNPLPPQTFNWQCETAFLGNDRGEVGITLMQLSAYTAEQCVEACGGLNVWRKEQICSAVTFQASMASEWNVGRGNCWLFNGTTSTWDDPGAKTCISASMGS